MASPTSRLLVFCVGILSLAAGCGKETPPTAGVGLDDKAKADRIEDVTQSFELHAQSNGLFQMRTIWREILAAEFLKLIGDDVEKATDKSKSFDANLVAKWGIGAPKLSQLDEKRASKAELFIVNCEQSSKSISKKHLDAVISESAEAKSKILEANPRVLVKYEVFDRSTGVGQRQDREQNILNPAKQAKLDADRDFAIATAYRKATDKIILAHMNQCKIDVLNAIAVHSAAFRQK